MRDKIKKLFGRMRAQKRSYRCLIGVAAAAVMLVAVLVLVRSCVGAGDALSGTWSLDGVTVYRFDGEGNGSLDLPLSTYPFKYEITDNSISIDFESESARDVTYRFSVRDDKLVLISDENGQRAVYRLTKENAK